MIDSHMSSTLPPLCVMSQKPGNAETAVMSEPHMYTRGRPSRSDMRPKKGIAKHITTAAAITPSSASVRLILIVLVR